MPENEKVASASLPEEFTLKGGKPRPLYPPVGDLVFKRKRSLKGIVYTADIRDWFKNGLPKSVKSVDKRNG